MNHNSPIRNDKLLREAYEAGRRQGLREQKQAPQGPGGMEYNPKGWLNEPGDYPYVTPFKQPDFHGTHDGHNIAVYDADGNVIGYWIWTCPNSCYWQYVPLG